MYEVFFFFDCVCEIIQTFDGFLESKSNKTAIKPGDSQGGAAVLSLSH